MKIHNATPIINNQQAKTKKNVTFSGKSGIIKDFFQLGRSGNFTRGLFIANAFAFLLGGRLVTSRDENERRETLTRDIPTIVIAVQGVPVIKNWVAKQIQKHTGFAIITEAKQVASSSQLQDWYKYDDKLASGFDGFSKRLVDCKGNLKKIYSSLGNDMKNKLANFSEDNSKFMEELSNHKELKQSIKEAFSHSGNKVLEQAAFLKTIPTIVGFAITLSTIGIFIPKLNIFITEKLNKNKSADEQPNNLKMP